MNKMKQKALFMLLTVFSYSYTFAQCPVPTGLNAVSNSPSSALLTWSSVPGASLYNIEVQDGKNNPTIFLVAANATVNSLSVGGMTPGLIYKFKVRTRCGGNKSDWSPYFQFAAGGGAINCVQMTGLTVSGNTATGAQFNWNASSGGLGYAVRVEDASGNPVEFLFNANTINNSFAMTGLNPASNYKVKVRKRCGPNANGPWTSWMFFSTTSLREGALASGNGNAGQLQVFPNPANDFMTVSFADANADQIQSIRLYDVNGRLVRATDQMTNQGNGYVVAVGGLTPGLYQVMVQTALGNATSRVSISR